MIGTGRGAELGVLTKQSETLERTRHMTTVVFDRTGTLTQGRMALTEITAAEGVDEDEALAGEGVRADVDGTTVWVGRRSLLTSQTLTLLRGDLPRGPLAINLSRSTYRVILQNLGWAFGYNIAATPSPRPGCSTP